VPIPKFPRKYAVPLSRIFASVVEALFAISKACPVPVPPPQIESLEYGVEVPIPILSDEVVNLITVPSSVQPAASFKFIVAQERVPDPLVERY